MRKPIFVLLFLFLAVIFSGCNNVQNKKQIKVTESEVDKLQYQKKLKDIIDSPHVVGAISGRDLLLVSPDNMESLPIYQIDDGQFPSLSLLDSTHFSQDHKFVIWYNPRHGVMYLDILNKKLKSIYSATKFLNINPYLRFANNANKVMFIDDEGNSLKVYDADTDQIQNLAIPYPYGNLFRLSPDNSKILFVSGFGQNNDKPKYMITDANGQLIDQFTTLSKISDRALIDWAYNSQGLYTVIDNDLNYYDIQSLDSPQVKFSIPENQHVLKMKIIDDNVFLLSDDGYWYIYSQTQHKELARTPISIAEELNNPVFLPISKNQFIINELMLGDEYEYHRLWISDLFGNKHLLLKQFAQTKINQEPLKVD